MGRDLSKSSKGASANNPGELGGLLTLDWGAERDFDNMWLVDDEEVEIDS